MILAALYLLNVVLQFRFVFQGVIRLYDIPDNTFESEESSDEESGGEDRDGETKYFQALTIIVF